MYRRYLYRPPRNDFNRLQREINELFSPPSYQKLHRAPCFPAVNVLADDDKALITAEVPGVNIKDVDISIEGDNLHISGELSADEKTEDVIYHRHERVCGKFERSIQLPFPVQSEKVKAVYEKGVLKVSLPRAEADKPKKIQISTK